MLTLVKDARMAILMSDKVDFGSNKITNDREITNDKRVNPPVGQKS